LPLQEEDYLSRQLRYDPDASIGTFDLSQIDFDELAANMKTRNSYLEAERLRSVLMLRLQRMIRVNPKRVDYLNLNRLQFSSPTRKAEYDYHSEHSLQHFLILLRDDGRTRERTRLV
jgi:hypothetical protein